MNGRPECDQDPPDAPAGGKPESFEHIPITERWAPLVRDPDRAAPTPPKLGLRIIASALSLIVLALLLWALA